VIDASDYYVIIIGGRYGSLDDTGLGYTEKEYDYAIQKKIPIIPLLHKNPNNLPREMTETDDTTWKKLQQFRAKVEKKHTCVYWQSPDDLKAHVIVGITTAIKRHPGVGWVRADQIPTQATVTEVLTLRDRVTELEAQVEQDRIAPPRGTEELEQGDDQFEVRGSFIARDQGESFGGNAYDAKIVLSWNDIFAAVAPTMINEATKSDVYDAFKNHFKQCFKDTFFGKKDLKGKKMVNSSFRDDQIETCIVQLRALGLIRESVRQRSVKDTETYWCLTPYGDFLMTQLRAIRKVPVESAGLKGEVTGEKKVE